MSGLADILAAQAPARLDWTYTRADTLTIGLTLRDAQGRRVPLDTVTAGQARVARVTGYAGYVDLQVAWSALTTGPTVGDVDVTITPAAASLLPDQGQWSLVLSGVGWSKTIAAGSVTLAHPATDYGCGEAPSCGCG